MEWERGRRDKGKDAREEGTVPRPFGSEGKRGGQKGSPRIPIHNNSMDVIGIPDPVGRRLDGQR